MLDNHVSTKSGIVGSAEFNLTLVNKMEPTATKRDMKKEMAYGMGKTSVGWHRDSGLKDFSSIAVYQTLKGPDISNGKGSWGVALRAMDGGAGGPLSSVPALLIPLPSGSLYYMLDEFNHNHEHAVIAGASGIRYSSTHRVAREGCGTWQYIRDKILSFSATSVDFDLTKGTVVVDVPSRKKKLVSYIRAQQNLLTEIEFEWLRQWFVQGQKHASLHPYWHEPIKTLCREFTKLERDTVQIIHTLQVLSKEGLADSHVTETVFDVLIEALSERSKSRKLWIERYNDPLFGQIHVDERPFSCSCLDRKQDGKEGHMPENLEPLISQLRTWRLLCVAHEKSDTNGNGKAPKSNEGKKQKKSGSLTKKESKRKASNWERLKANMKS